MYEGSDVIVEFLRRQDILIKYYTILVSRNARAVIEVKRFEATDNEPHVILI